ncbi:biopolymer transporter ExbD [Marivirga tractuosa]|uniref:Outer membrane transport energization protein ExbD n=1 Tax=Marivirga tractuosa (strain ATCC 23168 / DSM 4126 / NBRC 15989 / NCIMB 1408 / VKM B-1430 / H-43) TaxID=643867 RepID=E4TMN9_MARTH|nr:biopolymer transporter ExbD [Marivirga tractuosa]ADR20337.1 outer membrane transport energization protein ExbD [Marivirga tractuosa DSM 4126]BDD15221.1 biopolymer transporter ExbD [Marivirga tractuosa]
MSMKSRHNVDPAFSMSSMTDIIFLLLIFFMLTSSFITPSGLPVNLPSSKSTNIVMQKVSVTITKDMLYFVNDKRVAPADIETAIKRELRNADEGVVVLHIDKSVPTEHLVRVAGIASSLKAKVSIAAQPNE